MPELHAQVEEPGGRFDRHVLESLQRITDAALAYLSEEELLQELLRRLADALDVDTVAFLLLEGDALHARAAKGIEEEVEQGVRIPLGRGFAGRVAAERRPVVIDDVDRADIFNPILRQKGIRSLLGVPLLVEGRVLGVLHVGSLTPRHFTPDEQDLLQLAADRAALSIEHARLYEQQRVAEALQRRLLPPMTAESPGLDVAGRYRPAAGGGLGGDWYDIFAVADDSVWLVVGDVVGHGVEASAVMAQLRTALRAYAVEGHSPADALARVNELMWRLGPASMTTLACAVLDRPNECLELVNAGHPPPLVVTPGGGASYLTPHGTALGVISDPTYEAASFPLAAGSILMLYTDGLIERRGESIDEGLERLRSVAEGFTDVQALCAAVERLVPAEPADDVAFIAASAPAPLPAS